LSDLTVFLLGCVVFMIAATGAFQYGLVLFRSEDERQNRPAGWAEPGASRPEVRAPGGPVHGANQNQRPG
jgi:hypothetical protein